MDDDLKAAHDECVRTAEHNGRLRACNDIALMLLETGNDYQAFRRRLADYGESVANEGREEANAN